MRLAFPSLALALALGVLSTAHATPPGPSVRGPTAHKPSPAHHDTSKPAHTDHHNGQPDHHNGQADQHNGQTGNKDQHHPDHPHHQHHHAQGQSAQQNKGGQSGGGQSTASFRGMVVMVQVNADGKCGRVWARDGRGQVQMFHVSNSTQLGGTTTQGLKGLTAGSTVHVQANQQNATQVRANGQGTCSAGASMSQGAFRGRVVSAHRDRDGDRGSLTVQGANGGPTRHFKITGATHFAQQSSGGSGGQTNQFVRPGQSVAVHSHGGLALQVEVLSHSSSPAQGGSTAVASLSHGRR
ncbi:MAG TPA: hypothetical protein VFE78_04935 [Gemmataceae bacterium]|jgi:hypothetical protein|nr:hypothetical protein [Gemmataceae bacterium]